MGWAKTIGTWALLLTAVGTLVGAEVAKMELPEHPRLLFSRKGIAELKERINRYDWAKA